MAIITLTESQLKNIIKRVLTENPGLDGYTIVGYVTDSDVPYARGDYYVLFETNKLPTLENKSFKATMDALKISKDIKGSDSPVTGYIFSGLNKYIKLLPEYKDTAIDYAIFGPSKKEIIKRSNEIMLTINRNGNMAILKHNSNKKIEDGFIRIGMQPNGYSKSDFQSFSQPRSYFWGTNYGKDVSNNQMYEYVCELPINSIYPIDFDPDGLGSIDNVLRNGYEAIAYYMGGKKEWGTVIVSFQSLPIETVRKMMDYGKVYDANWDLIT